MSKTMVDGNVLKIRVTGKNWNETVRFFHSSQEPLAALKEKIYERFPSIRDKKSKLSWIGK